MAEGEDVLTLRLAEQGTQQMFVDTSKIPREEGGRRSWKSTGQCSIREEEWNEMHEKLKEVSKNFGVKNTGQKAAGLRTLAWRKSLKEIFFSAEASPSLSQKIGFAWEG